MPIPTGRQSDLRLRRRKLRLRRRREDSDSSLFARLSPSAVTRLHTDALCRAQALGEQECTTDGWNILERDGLNREVEFLPLSVKFNANLIIYVSFNGGEARDGIDGDILELPDCLIPDGFSGNEDILVAALPSVRNAPVLNVEPITTEDWELLESHAEFLEEGALLQQISVVYAEQKIPLWVGGKDFAWIKVLRDNFDEKDTVWPDVVASQESHGGCEGCLRLVADTRTCVAPKPKVGREPQVSPPLRVYPTSQDYSRPMIELGEAMQKGQVSPSPGTALVHPDTLNAIPGWHEQETSCLGIFWNTKHESGSEPDESIVLQVVAHMEVPHSHITLNRLDRIRLGIFPLVDKLNLRFLTPVEIARGAARFSQLCAQEKRLSLEIVDFKEVRTQQKWRFPFNDESILSCSMSNESSPHSQEDVTTPIEIGSFLLESSEKDSNGSSTIRRVKWNQDCSSCDAEIHCGNTALQERGFVQKSELHKFVECGERDLNKCVLELHATGNLQNLLSEISIVHPDLVDKNPAIHDAIIWGDNGSGKTHTALVLAACARFATSCSTFYLDCRKLKEGHNVRMKHILSELQDVFYAAQSCPGRSQIILDNFDELAPNLEISARGDESAQSHQMNPVAIDQSKLIADTARLLIETTVGPEKKVSVILTAHDVQSLPHSVLSSRPFVREIVVPSLSSCERELLLWRMICFGSVMSNSRPCLEFTAMRIGRKTENFYPKDLLVLASRIKYLLGNEMIFYSGSEIARCTALALVDFTPLRQLSITDSHSAAVDWSDIGGLFQVKRDLALTIMDPAKYRRIYEAAKIRLPRGVLIFGSPGCGKSYLIPALAKKCGFSLITCRGPELLDRYIGASEAKVRDLFSRARAAAPSILFFDEIDSLAPRRGSDKTGVTDRVVNQLLTLLDGVEDTTVGGLVYVVAATSRPDIVDPALLRPGRLEKHLYVGYPESDEELTDILSKAATRYSVDSALLKSIATGQVVQEMKHSQPYYDRLSAADLKAAFDTAQLAAVHEVLQMDKKDPPVVICHRHLIGALTQRRPSLPERDYSILMDAYRPYMKVPRGQRSGDGDSASGTGLHARNTGRIKELRTTLK